jgi:hypothetical protein
MGDLKDNIRAAGSRIVTRIATIAERESLSDSVPIYGMELVGISMPADWTAANITFEIDVGNGLQPVYASGSVLSDSGSGAAADLYLAIDPLELLGALSIAVRSGTPSSPVTQEAERELILVLRK